MRHLAYGIWVFAYSFIPKYFTKVEPGWSSSRSTWKLCEFTQTHKAVALTTFCGLFGDRSTVKILTMPQQFIDSRQKLAVLSEWEGRYPLSSLPIRLTLVNRGLLWADVCVGGQIVFSSVWVLSCAETQYEQRFEQMQILASCVSEEACFFTLT